MALDAQITALKAALPTASTAIKAAFTRKVQAAFLSDDSALLGGMSRTDLVSQADSHLTPHVSAANPHGTTAADLSMYTAAQIQDMVNALVPSGIIPLTQFGDLTPTALPVNVVAGGSPKASFAANIPLFMAGTAFVMPATDVPLTNNATNNVYVKLVAGVPQYVATTSYLPESNTNALVGVVTLASGVVTKNTLAKVTRVDIYRISTTPAGSAIPVSSGDPAATSTLLWK
jgi:hypothetical protein